MHFSLFALLPFALASPLLPRAEKPVYWLLAGDSTTAPKGGWGDAFLSTTVMAGSSGHNYGHSGATTASFRAGGDWGKVAEDIEAYKTKYNVYVTIQFGHNDQKEASGLTIEQYKSNLQRFAAEAKAAGATPVEIFLPFLKSSELISSDPSHPFDTSCLLRFEGGPEPCGSTRCHHLCRAIKQYTLCGLEYCFRELR